MRGKLQPILIVLLIGYSILTTYLWRDMATAFDRLYKENAKLRDQEQAQPVIAHNGTLEQQSSCANEADKVRAKRYQPLADTTVVLRIIKGHYNATLNRCLVLDRTTM